MWKSLVLLAILASLLISVSSNQSDKVKDKHTIITTITKADSNAEASANTDNGTASAEAGAAASVTTIVKTHVHTMKKCASHEKYVKCPKKLCTPQNCEEIGVLGCSKEKHIHEQEETESHEDKEKHARECGSPACFCKDDYVRIHGVCRPVTECSECGDDKNATVGCGVNCGRRCSNYMKKNISCPDTDYVCYENSCDCKKDYVFDDYTGKCVLPEDCSNKNAPDPDNVESTPGNGEPDENGENLCDGCNGHCAIEKKKNGSSDEDSRQKQCPTKDLPTTEKANEMSTQTNNKSSEEMGATTMQSGEGEEDMSSKVTEKSVTTTDEPEDGTEAPENTSTTTKGGNEDDSGNGDKESSNEGSTIATTTEKIGHTKTTASTTESSDCDKTNEECSGVDMTPATKKGTKEPKTTTTTSEEDICPEDPDTEESKTTSAGSDTTSSSKSSKKDKKTKLTTRQPENSKNESKNTTAKTEESAIESTTKEKHKKHKTTTALPCQEMNSESETMPAEFKKTSVAMMHKKTKKPKSTTNQPGYGKTEPENIATSEEAMESTTKKRHKKPKTTAATPDGINSEDPETEVTKATTRASSYKVSKGMTGAIETKSTTKSAEDQVTTLKNKRTRRPRTTTMNSDSGTPTTIKPKKSSKTTTGESGMETTTRRIRRTRKPSPKEEEDQSKSTKGMGEESKTTTATDECNGSHERYYKCASACPDYTCSDFLNHNNTRCNRRHGSNCMPGCRCRNGHYRNLEGKCVTSAHCRRQARSTTASGTMKGSEMKTQNDKICEEEALWPFIKANLGFTAKILAELSSQNENRNVLSSGSTVLFLLAQLALFANGDSQEQILEVLDLNTEQIKCLFPQLNENVTVDFADVEYNLFCNIIADNSCMLTEEFKDTIQDVFHTPPQNVNFTDEQSAVSLSDTVANFTGLQNFVTSKVLSSLSSLVLTDVQVFKGEWMKSFDPQETTEFDFYGSNGQPVRKPMMHQSNKFLYTESVSLGCKVLKMKYKGDDFTFAIFLPKSENGLNELVKKLSNVDDVVSTLDNLRLMNVEVYVPKFKETSSNRLKDYTKTANIDSIYSADTAGLHGVTSCEKSYVSDILQKLSFVVDETGNGKTSTGSYSTQEGPSNPHQRANTLMFKADHPFVYYVLYRKIVILSGTYVN